MDPNFQPHRELELWPLLCGDRTEEVGQGGTIGMRPGLQGHGYYGGGIRTLSRNSGWHPEDQY